MIIFIVALCMTTKTGPGKYYSGKEWLKGSTWDKNQGDRNVPMVNSSRVGNWDSSSVNETQDALISKKEKRLGGNYDTLFVASTARNPPAAPSKRPTPPSGIKNIKTKHYSSETFVLDTCVLCKK
jgi:hypothetical protein